MNKKFIYFALILLATVLSLTYSNSTLSASASYADTTTSEIILDARTNRVLFENNAYAKKYMASTTKILTALTVIENCNLEEEVTVSKDTVGVEGSSIYLEAGEKLSVKDLLYGLMLRSGNDCAETLAVYCAKSIDAFAKLMNETARRIGAYNSNFVNPHGLHDDEHFTTAYDLAIISSYAIKNQTFKEIVSTKSIDIPFTTRNTKRRLINKNKMLNEFDGATGIKTGYTKRAGRCLVTSCERDGLELICVVLNCPPMFERSKNLLTKTYEDYSVYKLVDSENIVDFVDVRGKSVGLFIKNDVVLPLTKGEKERVRIIYDYPKSLEKLPKNGEAIGDIKIYCENNLLFVEKIYTINTVN